MADFALFHHVIRERITNPNAQYHAEPWWDAEVKQFIENITESINFILQECTDEELYWLGEVYDDIMERTRSKAFLGCLRQRAEQVENPEWKASILDDIQTATEYLDE